MNTKLNKSNDISNASSYFKYNYKFSTNDSFVLKYDDKYCLFSLYNGYTESESNNIFIYCGDGSLYFANIFNLTVPEKCSVDKFENLVELANNWKKNYIGSY